MYIRSCDMSTHLKWLYKTRERSRVKCLHTSEAVSLPDLATVRPVFLKHHKSELNLEGSDRCHGLLLIVLDGEWVEEEWWSVLCNKLEAFMRKWWSFISADDDEYVLCCMGTERMVERNLKYLYGSESGSDSLIWRRLSWGSACALYLKVILLYMSVLKMVC